MIRPVPFVAALVLIGTSVGVAQQKNVVTTADYDRAVKMLAPSLNGLVVGDSVNVTWAPLRARGFAVVVWGVFLERSPAWIGGHTLL